MTINIALENALNLIKDQEESISRPALDDLLSANALNIEEFRAAIINHQAFWKTFPELTDAVYQNDDGLLTNEGSPNPKKIQKLAAEQRVLSGLKDAEDAVLISILSNNPEECRAYLASKAEFGSLADATQHWIDRASVPAPDPILEGEPGSEEQPVPVEPEKANQLTDVLSDEFILQIQDDVRNKLLIKLKNHITAQITDIEPLKKLEEILELAKFKEALIEMGVDSCEWMKENDVIQVKQAIRLRHFQLAIEQISQLGAAAHPQLINVYKALSVKKQREVLNDSQLLRHFLASLDLNELTRYLEHTTSGLSPLVDENNRLSSFRALHLAEVARILAQFEPAIELTEQAISDINNHLAMALNESADFFNEASYYKAFIDHIQKVCGIADEHIPGLYNAFDLTAEGAFKENSLVKNKIVEQSNKNKEINAQYLLEKGVNKQLLGLFLTLEKMVDLDPPQIKAAFASAGSFKKFIETVIPSQDKIAQDRFALQFSSATFYKLKNEMITNQLIDSGQINSGINSANEILKNIHKDHKTVSKLSSQFKFLEKVKLNYFYNSAFLSMDRADARFMLEKYETLAKDCYLIVDTLRRNQEKINNLISGVNTALENAAQIEKSNLTRLLNELEKELQLVNADLIFYEAIHEKLSGPQGIVHAVTDAANNKKTYEFKAPGVTRKVVRRNEIASLAYASAPAMNNSGVDTNGLSGGMQQFLLSNKIIPSDQITVVDVVQTQYGEDGVTPTFECQGRYTVDFSSSDQVIQKKDNIHKISGGKFEIEQSPQQVIPQSPVDPRMMQVHIDFYTQFASDVIASLDKAPTKNNPLIIYSANENEMRWMWTALLVMGEKNPHMKFGSDALKLACYGDNKFNPDSEKRVFKGISAGFRKQSLYTQFKKAEHQPFIQKKRDALDEVNRQKKEDKATRAKVDPKAVAAYKALKEGFQDLTAFRQKAEEIIKDEGSKNKLS